MKKLLGGLFLIFLFTSCKNEKVPVADFNVSKAEYVSGETIELTNASANAETIKWTLPDGTTSKANTVSFTTTQAGIAQSFNFKLEAVSKSGTKSDYVVKKIQTKPTTGKLVIYTGPIIDGLRGYITIINDNKGLVTLKSSSTPPKCGEETFINYDVPIGTVVVKFTDAGLFPSTLVYTVTILPNECSQLRIEY